MCRRRADDLRPDPNWQHSGHSAAAAVTRVLSIAAVLSFACVVAINSNTLHGSCWIVFNVGTFNVERMLLLLLLLLLTISDDITRYPFALLGTVINLH